MDSDKIQLEGMRFYGFHGVESAEQLLGQVFVVDLEILCDQETCTLKDNEWGNICKWRTTALYKCGRHPTHRDVLEWGLQRQKWFDSPVFDVW